MASAWGASWGAYWGNSWGSVTTPAEVVAGGGGYPRYHPWIHGRRKYIEQEGIPEVVAEAVVAAVEKAAADSPVADQKRKIAQAENELRAFVEDQRFEWQAVLANLIRIEYARLIQEQEEAQIVWMLFEM